MMFSCMTGSRQDENLAIHVGEGDGCCAVITGNTMVVMGGENDEYDDLSSVECFTIGGSTWEYLPSMNEERSLAVAEVLPSTRFEI